MLKVNDLTRSEKLRLARRRTKTNQTEAAENFGVTVLLYRAWESDPESEPPDISLGKLKTCEQFWILRRRANLTLVDLAAEIGISPYWLHLMETGTAPIGRLRKYWEARLR